MSGGESLSAHTVGVGRGGRTCTGVASHLGKTVGCGRSLKWADWVHVTNFVSRWLDSGFEGARGGFPTDKNIYSCGTGERQYSQPVRLQGLWNQTGCY